MKKEHKYFRIAATEADKRTAELYLYGSIGQEKWWDDDPTEALTDLEVVRAIRELEQSYSRINVRINSPGGSVMHGDPIITALRNSTADIHTYNDGMAASMAFDIWLAGGTRHISTHSKLMAHATASIAIGTAKDMRNAAAMLDTFDSTSIASFALATGMDEDDIRTRFFDYEDHWITAREAKDLGLVKEIEDYKAASPVQEPEKMSFRQLLAVAHRVAMPEPEQKESEPEPGYDIEAWREDYLARRNSLTKKAFNHED